MERLSLCSQALYNEDILTKMKEIEYLKLELSEARIKLERYLDHALFFNSRDVYIEKKEQKEETIRVAFHEYISGLDYCREIRGHRLRTARGTRSSISKLTDDIRSAYEELGAEKGWATQEATRTFLNLCVYLHANPFDGSMILPLGWNNARALYETTVHRLVDQVIALLQPPMEFCFVCSECDTGIITVTDVDDPPDECNECNECNVCT